MKGKKFLILLIFALCTLMFAGCGGDQQEAATQDEESEEVFVMKWAHSSPVSGDRLPDASIQIIKEIKEESNGRLVFEHYPASQLGAEREQLEGVSFGTIDVCIVSTGPIPTFFPEIAVTSIPYLLTDRETAWKIYDGEFGQTLAKDMEEATGIKVFGWAENGFRTFSNSKVAIHTPADMKGIKIRTMEHPIHMEMVKLLGGSAIPVTFAELYTALSQGTVDGQENGIALTYTNKLYENLKYLTLDRHIYDVYGVFMAQSSYDKLPADLQELLDRKMRDFIDLEREMNVQFDESSLQAMLEAGIEVIELTDDEMQQFKDATAPLLDTIRETAGDSIVDLLLSEVERLSQ